MFKPTVFRFDNAVQWPGAGPTTEIHAETVRETKDEAEQYVFVHASGAAIKVDKAQVTVYGTWEDDNIPNMPSPDKYPDGTQAENPDESVDVAPDADSDKTGEELDAEAQADSKQDTEGSNPVSDGDASGNIDDASGLPSSEGTTDLNAAIIDNQQPAVDDTRSTSPDDSTQSPIDGIPSNLPDAAGTTDNVPEDTSDTDDTTGTDSDNPLDLMSQLKGKRKKK